MSFLGDFNSSLGFIPLDDIISHCGPNMPQVFKDGYGVDIDPTKVIPSITSPFGSPRHWRFTTYAKARVWKKEKKRWRL